MKKLILAFWGLVPFVVLCQIQNPKHFVYNWNTDTSNHTVDLYDLTMAAQKDELPTLDYPKFISRSDQNNHFYDQEPVIAISFNGQAKAYPLSLLTLFELSNDSLGGQELMITYCPMCNAAIVFNRKIKKDGKEYLLNFGISGLLMHNDMVMYDKQTNTWWEQLMGSGVVGQLAGTELEMMPAYLISVKDYFDRFPDGKILSPEGIHMLKKHHHKAFYHMEHDTEMLDSAYYVPEKVDPRLPPLERVLDIHLADHITIYPFSVLAHEKVLNERFENLRFCIFYHGETVSVLDNDKLSKSRHVGSATAFRSVLGSDTFTFQKSGNYFVDDQTHSLWDITGYCHEGPRKGKQLNHLAHSSHFAFAYLAFYPECEIYKGKKE